MNTYISKLSDFEGKEVTLQGWVSNSRDSKGLIFIVLRDGTGFCQCVVSEETVGAEQFGEAKKLTQESAVALTGKIVKDERQMGGYELQATAVTVISIAEEYPISNKEHGVDFLMDNRHLWLRSRRQWAIMRVRNKIIYAIHQFFQERDFVLMDAPIFTGNACEGTSTLFETDFYGSPAYLSQSGQLYGEAMALAQSKIYTFGPTFRAEKSKTRRHLSEFWMIEPEMAFATLDEDMDVIEDFVRYVIRAVIKDCRYELETYIERDVKTLEKADATFPRITYDEAVEIIKGKRNVNGRNSIETLINDLKEIRQQIAENEADISLREIVVANKKSNDDELQVIRLRLLEMKDSGLFIKREIEKGKESLLTATPDEAKDFEAQIDAYMLQLRGLDAEADIFQKKIDGIALKKGEINLNINAIAKLKQANKSLEEKAQNIPQWLESAKNFVHGNDLGGSDETVITRLFDTPVMVYKWPKAVKAFYMKTDENDPNYVKGVDLLAPEGFGEIVGGGERETNKEYLIEQIKKHELPMKEFEWYLDLRRFGSVPHAGFGLGLERVVAYICGLPHIRETSPFPRMYGRLFP